MKRRYIPREIEPSVLQAASQFPVIVITGARQTGKSTMLRQLFPQHQYITLDDPLARAFAHDDPNGVLLLSR